MNVRRVPITTAADGSASKTVRCPGEIEGILVVLGDLSTPDIAISDHLSAKSVLSVSGLAATTAYRPRALAQTTAGANIAAAAGPPVVNNVYAPVVCYGELDIAITGGGDTKSGTIYIAFRG